MKEKVREIIAEAIHVSKEVLTDDLSIGGIPEWDSVGNLTIIRALEEELDVEIPLDDLFDLTSIKALVEEIEKLKA